MKKVLSLLFLSFAITHLFAQEFEIPYNYVLDKAEDYPRYEKDIVQCVDWLKETPVNEKPAKRKEANAFLMKWISGSPYVSIEIKQEIVNFIEPNADLLIIFMGAWTKYALETKDFKNKLQGNLKGLESVIAFYQKNKTSLRKDRNVEKYAKMKEKGILEEYVKANL